MSPPRVFEIEDDVHGGSDDGSEAHDMEPDDRIQKIALVREPMNQRASLRATALQEPFHANEPTLLQRVTNIGKRELRASLAGRGRQLAGATLTVARHEACPSSIFSCKGRFT
jgi:hypothetical protein